MAQYRCRCGYCQRRGFRNLYHVASRHFEAPEVKLLIDAVQSARFITPRKGRALVKRLSSFIAPGGTALLNRHLYIDSRSKATNESIYLNVDRIQTAITERKKISFCYFDYSPSKERVRRRSGQVYSVSPFAMLWNNDTYYSSASMIIGSRLQSFALTASFRWRSRMKLR